MPNWLAILAAILISALLNSLLFLVIRERNENIRLIRRNGRLDSTNQTLQGKINDLEVLLQKRINQEFYDRGLHDGRETDALYRGMLEKIRQGEQATVLMGNATAGGI
jgi:hypothetical protein